MLQLETKIYSAAKIICKLKIIHWNKNKLIHDIEHTKVVTQNCSPAPSQSEAVIIGLEIQTNPFSWKNLWVA